MASIFSRIIAGEAPASFVHRDELAVAFLDIMPLTAGHTLVVPVAECSSLTDLPPETLAHLTALAQRIGKALRAADSTITGLNWLLCDGKDAGQEVFHVHLHVIPRRPGDGLRLGGKPSKAERAELDEWALKLETCLTLPSE